MIARLFRFAAGLCLLGLAAIPSAQAEPRIALVIGNSNYGSEIGKLGNPANDAALMEKALQQTGFQVTKVIDANQKTMKRAIIDFGDKLTSAGTEATGLFFYAGHGVQVKGINYLVPVGADISKEGDVDLEAVAADTILQQMEYAGSRVNIVVLDACRNNPLQRSMRSQTRGLAPMDAAQGTFVAYSTAPGQTAADGSGQNSPYTQALAATIVKPGVGIEEAFRDVRASVMQATKGADGKAQQVPWDSSSLTAPFYFKPASAQSTTAAQPAPAQAPAAQSAAGATQAEKDLWEEVKNSKQASDFEAYLTQYPNGAYAPLARNRMASLGSGAPRSEPAAPATAKPAAAPVVEPQPDPAPAAPAATEVSTTSQPAKSTSGPELDARGVDCRIMDTTRGADECKKTKKAAPANKPNGHRS